MKLTLYRAFCGEKRKSWPNLLVSRSSVYKSCSFTLVTMLTAYETEDNTETEMSSSDLDLNLEIDSKSGFRTKLNDKKRYVNFPIVTFLSKWQHPSRT